MRPSKTQLKKSLLEGLFDPRSPGPGMGIVIEADSTKYLEIRAIEYIKEARLALNQGDLPPGQGEEDYQERMSKALSLIALAKIII